MILSMLAVVAWVACVHLAAWAIGRHLRFLLTRGAESLDAVAHPAFLEAILGFIVLGNAALALGAAGLLRASLLVALVLALASWGLVTLLGMARRSSHRRWRPVLDDIPLAVAVAFTAFYVPAALHPTLPWDDNVYHVFLPRTYLSHQAITAIPWSMFANMPHLVEMIYTFPMALGDFTAPKLLALSINFWIIVGLASFGAKLLGRVGGGVVALLYVSGKNVQWHFETAYVEPVIGAFLLAAVLGLLGWQRTRNAGYLGMTGIFCGATFASKYSAWPFALLVVGTSCVLVLLSDNAARRKARLCAATIGGSALLPLPWFLKNAIITGNPIYPNMYRVFGGSYWSESQSLHLARLLATYGGYEKDWASYLLLPYNLFVKPFNFFESEPPSASLMVLLLLALLLPSSWRATHRLITLLAPVGFLLWVGSVQHGRYLVAWVPIMVLTASIALVPLRGRRWAMCLIAGGVAAVGLLQGLHKPSNPLLDVFLHSREELLPDNFLYEICEHLNETLPPDARLLTLWENRWYFLERPVLADNFVQTSWIRRWAGDHKDAADFAATLSRLGVTHVTINKNILRRWSSGQYPMDLFDPVVYPHERLDKELKVLKDLVEQRLDYVETLGGWLLVYRLPPPGGKPPRG